MIWLLRLLALAAVWLFVRGLWRWLQGGEPARPLSAARPTHRGTFKRDPVCGVHVDAALALEAVREGETFHFCSERCREAFLIRIATPAGAPK